MASSRPRTTRKLSVRPRSGFPGRITTKHSAPWPTDLFATDSAGRWRLVAAAAIGYALGREASDIRRLGAPARSWFLRGGISQGDRRVVADCPTRRTQTPVEPWVVGESVLRLGEQYPDGLRCVLGNSEARPARRR